ncbi:MAG: PAS domain S-box protein [Rubinisphaera brasiliensis]|uniref:PAS domain S-box protein n=1 Tax=Rubinisphaera brasiliensis TaxID=119 RepID=UPI00391AAC14
MIPVHSQALLDSLPDATLLVSRKGIVLACNRAAKTLLSASSDPTGQPLHELWNETAEQVEELLRTFSQASHAVPGKLRLSGDSGSEQTVQCYGSRLAVAEDSAEDQIVLRLVPPKEALQQFSVLNEKIAQLTEEVTRRRLSERNLRRERERLKTTLASIGDAVIVTDPEGRVTMMNGVAERLTGWNQKEANTQPLTSVFRIINETTRATVENPVAKVIATGAVVGLANHTILISRTGEEWPIDDSASPILDDDGKLLGIILIFRDITEQHAWLNRLEESENRFRNVVESRMIGIGFWNATGEITDANDLLLEMIGYSRQDLEQNKISWRDLTPEEFHEKDERALKENNEQGFSTPYEKEWIHKSGQRIPILIGSSCLPGEEVRGSFWVLDMTRERAARQTLELQASVLESMTEGVCVLNEAGLVIYRNRAERVLLGLEVDSEQESLPQRPVCQIPAEAMPILEAHGTWEGESRYQRPDGRILILFARIAQVNMEGEQFFVRVHEDVTARRAADDQLHESEERFRQLAENIDDVFYIADVETGSLSYVSPSFKRTWGVDPTRLKSSDPLFSAVHPRDQDHVRESLQRRKRGEATVCEFRIFTPGGQLKWIRDRSFPIRDSAGHVARIAGVAEDMTERKRIELDLRFLSEASRSLSGLIDFESTLQVVASLAVPDFADWCLVHIADSEGQMIPLAVAHVNPDKVSEAIRVSEQFPPSSEDSAGAGRVFRTGKPEMLETISEDFLQAVAQNDKHLEILRAFQMESYMSVPLTLRGEVLGVISFVTAESARRYKKADLDVAVDLAHRAAVAIDNARLYSDLKDADRRKDEFLAMLAHELRNPLAPIRSGLDLLRIGEQRPEVLELMDNQLQHLVRLVDDLLDVSRILRGKVELRKEQVELRELITRTVDAVNDQFTSRNQELTVRLPDAACWLNGDSVRLSQVIHNLLSNASKYTPPDGKVSISLERTERFLRISVRDSGIGIDSKLLPHVFELFTQAERSIDRSQGGLGIGLTVVKSLIELHGGTVSARSKGKGKGSEFRIRLPVRGNQRQVETDEQPSSPISNETARILVVDDNLAAAKMLSMLLGAIGKHEIRMAHDGVEALAAAAAFKPDIVLLDIGLPKMDGYEVAKRLRERPETADILLVALTGYGTPEDIQRSLSVGFDEHVVKPPSLDRLKAVLNKKHDDSDDTQPSKPE